MNLPSLRQLQYLIAVVELKHFGQAAKRCFVTQSTLSNAIIELEDLLKLRLLERTNRKVIPTDIGLEMAERARHILGLTHDLVDRAKVSHELLNGELKLGIIPTIAPFLLPNILPEISRRYPNLHLYLVEDQSNRLLQRLSKGELDAAILAFPYDTGNYHKNIFWQENFKLVLPQHHPLAMQQKISSKSLPIDELLLLEEGHCLRDHALDVCHLQDVSQSAAFQGTSIYTLLQMVSNGIGMTFVPEMALTSDFIKNTRCTFIDLNEPSPHREIGIVWRPSFHRVKDLQQLSDTIRDILLA